MSPGGCSEQEFSSWEEDIQNGDCGERLFLWKGYSSSLEVLGRVGRPRSYG